MSGSDTLPPVAKNIPSTLRRERREDEPFYDNAVGVFLCTIIIIIIIINIGLWVVLLIL